MGNSLGWMAFFCFNFYPALPGLCWVLFECYVLCVLIMRVEIFDKHFMLLLATSKTKIKGEQVPQSINE